MPGLRNEQRSSSVLPFPRSVCMKAADDNGISKSSHDTQNRPQRLSQSARAPGQKKQQS